MKHFEAATIKLTLLYMGLLMALSLIFSIWLYTAANRELRIAWSAEPSATVTTIDDGRIQAGSQRLLRDLIYFNLVVLGGGTLLSYLLARRTLRPIQQNYQLQEEFASNASHQLRTPLTILKGELQLVAQDKKATPATYQAAVATSLEEVDRLIDLSARLLRLSADSPSQTGRSNVEQTVQKVLAHMEPLLNKKHVTTTVNIPPLTASIHQADLLEILGIILDNAIKYSPAKNSIEIQATMQGHQVVISVIDHGPGITPQDMPHIFERFYRGARTGASDGYGLGLALAQKLTTEAGGTITAESKPGRTCFTIFLPN